MGWVGAPALTPPITMLSSSPVERGRRDVDDVRWAWRLTDHQTTEVHDYGRGRMTSEPVFVRKPGATTEDEG